jgi:hypothetical protein
MKTRKAKKEDIPILCSWINKLVQHVSIVTSDEYLFAANKINTVELFKTIQKDIKSPKSVIIIGEINKKPICFIKGSIGKSFVSDSKIKQIGYIEMCWIEPTERKKGIARQLECNLVSWFKNKMIKYVDVNYLIGNKDAEKVWKKLGYKPYRIASRKNISK